MLLLWFLLVGESVRKRAGFFNLKISSNLKLKKRKRSIKQGAYRAFIESKNLNQMKKFLGVLPGFILVFFNGFSA